VAVAVGSGARYGGDTAALFGARPVNAGGTSCPVTSALRAYHPTGGALAAGGALVDAVQATISDTEAGPPPR